MRRYFDAKVSDREIADEVPELMEKTSEFDPITARKALTTSGFDKGKIVRYAYRPFDNRWLYWNAEAKLLDRPRPDFVPQVFDGNHFFESRQKQTLDGFDRGSTVNVLGDNWGNGLSSYFPLYLRETNSLLANDTNAIRDNLTPAAADYLRRNACQAADLFFHAIAIMHSPAYRSENAGGLRQDWPRIPLPADAGALHASAALGREIAALLDTEKPVTGVTAGPIRPELKTIAVISTTTGKPLAADEFALTAGWGHGGSFTKPGKPTMPAKGKLETRAATAAEANATLGSATTTHDIYLNTTAHWKNIAPQVWEYTIGGYQVIKKWLSYREQRVLGRALSIEEIKEVTSIARRIAALILLNAQLDANYRAICRKTVRLN